MSCSVGHRIGLDPELLWLWLWLWHGPAAAALIRPVAWEPPCAASVPPQKKRQKKRNLPHEFVGEAKLDLSSLRVLN